MVTDPASASVSAEAAPIGIALIDPLPVVRSGMRLLIDGRPDMRVVVEAGAADEGIDEIGKARVNGLVVIVGLGIEGGHDAHWLIREIRERFPSCAILACGARADAIAISRALFVGADGFVDKTVDPVEFLQAIRSAAAGEMVLVGPPLEIVGAIAEGLERRREMESKLTHREREVLAIAAEGLTARQIADRLGVRERTITTHLARIYGKLGVGTRLAAIRAAARSGLVSVGTGE